MTRKTRAEKQLADYRRRLRLNKQNLPPETKQQKNLNPVKNAENKPSSESEAKYQSYFRKDLKRSLLFIFLIITLEIIIYFARIKIY